MKIFFPLQAILSFSILSLYEAKILFGPNGGNDLPDDSRIDTVKKLPDANSTEFNGTIIYEPFGNDWIRLSGNSTDYNHGLVKVFRNKTWGYVCDDDWDIKDANVACRQLGFNRGAAKFVSASWYGEAENGLYLMDDVKCIGDEKQLQKCSYNIYHDCDKNEAAGVICNLNTGCEDQWISGPTGCYRLFDGSFTRYNAENKCKSLNGHLVKIETQEENNFLSSILRMWKEKYYWLTDGIKEQNWIWKTDGKPISPSFWFPGWEPQSQFPKPSNNTLKNCLALANAFKYKDSKYLSEYFYWHDINCNTVGNFICETEKTETPSADECYTGNGTDYRGSKSVTINGTLCLMWTRSTEINPSTHPNAGLGDHNYCRNPDGDSRPWCWVNHQLKLFSYCDVPKCSIITEITKDIVPKAPIKIELVGGPSELSGRIEIIRNGVRGTVCDDSFDNNDAKVICRMMGHSFGQAIPNIFGEGNGTIWLDDLSCTGSEYNLEACPNLSWGTHNCQHSEDVAIYCFEDANTTAIKIELVGGASELSGRIEITRYGIRGTVCDDSFDNNDAKVICRMMGYSSGEAIPNIFGEGNGAIWLDELSCTGSEYDLEACPNLSWGTHDCSHSEDVAIKCFKESNTTAIKIELVGGPSELSGRIEITRYGIRGTVCDDFFDNNDAKVICRMMGYSFGQAIPNIFGEGNGTIWLDDLSCTGSEYNLEACPNLSWGTHNCQHSEDVAIYCFEDANTTAIKIELVGGASELSGRIEITRYGIRGTVCDDSFDNNDAKVICRMMGYSFGKAIPNIFGEGNGTIWLDDLSCTGSEYDLEACPNLSWGTHNCGHNKDVAIKCFKESNTTAIKIELVGGPSELSGRIEITRYGIRGTVCDDFFDNNDAKVICRMMGYSFGQAIPNIFGEGNGTIWLDELSCTGSEYDLEACPNLSWGTHDCSHSEDVAIKCFKESNTTAIKIELVGGPSELSGRIEITRNGIRGTVCDDSFDNNDAKVICRMMGYSSGEEIPNMFGKGNGTIWLDELSCTGSEYDLEACPNLYWGTHDCSHSEDVAIYCFEDANTTAIKIELVGGASELSGRIEITRYGIRGTVCNDSFDNNDAIVICRMMGYSFGKAIPNIFGEGNGTIWLDDLSCTGSEYDLEACPNLSWGTHNCGHNKDVAIKCFKESNTTAIKIELVGGPSELSGRIEITRYGIRGTVCDDFFDNNDAKVICRMMGYSFGQAIPNIFGEGNGTIWLDDLSCTGSEYDLEACPNLSWGTHDCSHSEDVAIKCFKESNTTAIKIELVGGPSELSGRIEITRNGIRGTVCDDSFDNNDAKVICRMMGYSFGQAIPNTFGEGNGTIWLDELSCTGSEYDLEACPNLSWGMHDCSHSEDVAIYCFEDANTTAIKIELVGGASELSGRIEITRYGIRGTVCNDSFDNNDAIVICRMMGYSFGKAIPNIFGEGNGTIWLDDLSCTGSEYDLEACPNLAWGTHNCGHNKDVAIKCFKESNTTAIKIELVGGPSEFSGRIEITRYGIRGTVCDDSFDNNDAIVICRMMGYSSGEEIPNTFGEGNGTIWLDDLSCTGSEYDLEACPNLSWGTHNCGHNEDVAIKCFKESNTSVTTATSTTPILSTNQIAIKIELVGGPSELSGIIEITRNGIRGTVCDDSFDNNDAKVICRMMGYSSGEAISNMFGKGNGTIWLDELSCTGSEYNLEACPNLSWGTHDCTHSEDVAIKCFKESNTTAIKIELVGGPSELSGIIEITRNGVRGTVCDDSFDNNDAKVICRMMGYSSGEAIPNMFGEGNGTIWLDDLSCTGSEYNLEACPNLSWGTHNCGHNEDVAIKCFKESNTTAIKIELVGGSSELSGRIEITRNGTRGTVCDDSFDNNDAKVICRMMGYSSGEAIPNIFGEGNGTIWLDDLNCTGSEYDLEACPNISWGAHNCQHSEDVAIKCFKESNTTVTCGKRPIKQRYQRFPGGQVAKYGAFPWQARILEVWFWGKTHHCGAAIINKYWLLTAAHCLKNKLRKENTLLRTGDLNSKIWDIYEQSFQAEHLIVHPSYDGLTHDYDVALIKLQPDRNGNGIVFNDYVQPVCLSPQNLNMSAITHCEISGWGSTGQTYTSILKAATVPMLSRQVCELIYKDITPRMLCAGYLQGGINACQGDRGGPLVCNVNGVHTLVGITSWGNGCATPTHPGVYANVKNLKTWIMATIAKYS